jgi:hypothetical protein
MRLDHYILDVPASPADGAAQNVAAYQGGTVQAFGTFAATLQVQGKLEGGDWVNIGSALTAPGFVTISDSNGCPLSVAFLRIRTTAYTSGTPQAKFAGFNSRSDV